MKSLNLLYSILLTLSIHSFETEAQRNPPNAILLSNVKSITLRQGLKTNHRRVAAVPQLKCVGGNAKGLYDIDVMRCVNEGSDYEDEAIQWTCTASLPEDFRLGSTDVICEGYQSAADPYILKGSCGVEYRLILTDAGEEKYSRKVPNPLDDLKKTGRLSWSSLFFWGSFFIVAAWMVYTAFFRIRRAPTAGGRELPRSPWGWGGGGGGPGGDPPPPPYDFYSNKPTTPKTPSAWKPGFWSGVLGGAAGGYMAGNRGTPARNTGLAPNTTTTTAAGNGEGSSRSSGTSAPATTTARHESAGFGSTKRR